MWPVKRFHLYVYQSRRAKNSITNENKINKFTKKNFFTCNNVYNESTEKKIKINIIQACAMGL